MNTRAFTLLLTSLIINPAAAVELTYAKRNFDYSADYLGAKATGTGSIQELGFHYNDHEYFELMGVLEESDTKQDLILGIVIGDTWVEYRTGKYDFVVDYEETISGDSFSFSETVNTEYQRIDLYLGTSVDYQCDGDLIKNEVCRKRAGFSYIEYTAPVSVRYRPFQSGNDFDYLDEEYQYVALASKIRSFGLGTSIDFEPKSFGLYRRWSSHMGIAQAQYKNVKTLCCSEDARSDADIFIEGDKSNLVWHIDYYAALGLALNIPLNDNGARIMGSLSYDFQGNYTMPLLLFAELELEEGDHQMELVNFWQGVRAALNVIF